MKLLIAENLKLPPDFATQTACIFGKRGSGKSSTGARIAEQLHGAGVPFAVLDPPDAWWGLKSSKDGKSPGIPVYVFGGRHGDLPLESGAGALLADVVVDHRINVIMSLRHFSNLERARFCIDFAGRLFARNTEPLMLFCEEAHRLFPQSREEYGRGSRIEEMLGAMNKLQTEGRTSGIGLTLIAQRPALVHATARAQAEILISHRIIGSHDRDAVDHWIKYHHQDEEKRTEFLTSLATLKTGECWFWGPEYPEEHPIGLRRVQVLMPETYDSRRTPKPGEHRTEPKQLAEVDLDKLRSKMAATIERAKSEDPKELKKQIAALQAEVKKKLLPAPAPQIDPAAIERAATDAAKKRDAEWEMKLRSVRTLLMKSWERFVDEIMSALHPGEFKAPERPRLAMPALPPAPRPAARSMREPDGKLPKAERKIMSALAQYPQGRSKTQIAILAGYAHSGGGFNNALASLRGKGLLEGYDTMRATDAGLSALGDYDPLPTGTALAEYWYSQLPRAERVILEVLVEYGCGHPMSKEQVAQAVGYEASGGGFNNALSKLRTLELIEGRSEVRASENLF